MNYSTVDPKVYGIKITSTSQVPPSDGVSGRAAGNKEDGSGSTDKPPDQLSPASPATLRAASSARQNTSQLVDGTGDDGDTNTREAARQAQQEKRKAQTERQEEIRKRRRREVIAGEVGHEVDSDGEREYWQAMEEREAAEDARRQALSPEARRKEVIEDAAKIFRDHIKPQLTLDYSGNVRIGHYPLFLLQLAPDSRNGAGCGLRHCAHRIKPGQYRIAVLPGSGYWRGPGKISSVLK